LDWVAPNSAGERFLKIFRQPAEPSHKLLWNYQSLTAFLYQHGFSVILLEYFDRRGRFHRSNWSEADGRIWRRAGGGWSWLLSQVVNAPYTSLIVDAVKQC
jgi:predicted SAM-dependent methyltransferase